MSRAIQLGLRWFIQWLVGIGVSPWYWYDDVIKWKHFPPYWPFVRGIHRWPVNSPYKGHWHGALIVSLIYPSTNGWVNNPDTGDLKRHSAHYDVTVVETTVPSHWKSRVVTMPNLSSLWHRRIVITTTFGATSDNKVGFQRHNSHCMHGRRRVAPFLYFYKSEILKLPMKCLNF